MKTFEEDNKLREIIKDLKLESPGKDFTMNVLDRIHKEVPFAFQIRKEPVLGKGFWIILGSFFVIAVVLIIMSGSVSGPEGIIGNFLKSVDTGSAGNTYNSLIKQIGNIPAGIIGILLGSSLLVFLESFLSLKRSKS